MRAESGSAKLGAAPEARANPGAEHQVPLGLVQVEAVQVEAWCIDLIHPSSSPTMSRLRKLPLNVDYCLGIQTGQVGQWLTETHCLERKLTSMTGVPRQRESMERMVTLLSRPLLILVQERAMKCFVLPVLNIPQLSPTTEIVVSALDQLHLQAEGAGAVAVPGAGVLLYPYL